MQVLIPWTDTGCTHRRRAFEWCRDWWQFNGIEVLTASGSRSAARNAVARQASGDVLIFADADTALQPDQLEQATDRARVTGQLTPAFDELVQLSRHAKLGSRLPSQRAKVVGRVVRGSALGVVAVPRPLWELVGGFDERFTVWGGEDRAFYYACEVLGDGIAERVPGKAWHLWHPPAARERRQPEYLAGLRLAERYKQCTDRSRPEGVLRRTVGGADKAELLNILSEPGGPRAVIADSASLNSEERATQRLSQNLEGGVPRGSVRLGG